MAFCMGLRELPSRDKDEKGVSLEQFCPILGQLRRFLRAEEGTPAGVPWVSLAVVIEEIHLFLNGDAQARTRIRS